MRSPDPKVIAFDVVETMFSLEPLREPLAKKDVRLESFFARVLRDGFALSAARDYRPFAEVARSALTAVAPESTADERAGVLDLFSELPPHSDVESALGRANEAGARVITLTNTSSETAERLLACAGLRSFVERVVSVDDVCAWKPSLQPYLHAAAAVRLTPSELALVAVHSWDIHGARRAGLMTGWCSRLEGRYSRLFDPPDVVGADLVAVVDGLVAFPERL
jgi:2-haloacid dehalogenase